MNGDLEVRRFEVEDDGQQLNVKLQVYNSSGRTVHVYREVRGVRYDEPSKTLRLLLTDKYVTEGPVRFMTPRPPLVAIDPGESETLSLRVPRTVTHIGAEVSGRPGPALREIHVHEAEAVEVEITWSDTPFYQEPGDKRGRVEQLRRWERGTIEARLDRRDGSIGPAAGGTPSQE